MSDNLPVQREPDRTPARVADTDSWIPVVQNIAVLAERIAETEFVPRSMRNKPAAVAAAILYGREVGLPPMTALTQTHVIEGKPSMSAEAMRAMIIAAGHDLVIEEATGAVVRLRGRRVGAETWTTWEWNIDMARAAGLTGKDNWKKYPRAMLLARCTADLARAVFPDVIHGFKALEEVQDMDREDIGAAEPAPASTAKVSRAPRQRRAAQLPAAKAPAADATPVAEVPLPGEPGYDDMAPQTPVAGEASTSDGAPPAEPNPVPSGDGPAGPAGDAASDDDDTGGPTAADDSSQAVDVGQDNEDATEPAAEESGEAAASPPPRAPSRAQTRMLMGQLSEFGIANDTEERHAVASRILGRPVDTFKSLKSDEVKALIDTLGRCKTLAELYRLLDAMDQAEAEHEREPVAGIDRAGLLGVQDGGE